MKVKVQNVEESCSSVVCPLEGVCLSIYTRAMAVLLAIFGMETRDAPPQHESMPLPEEGVAERRQEGSGRPLTRPSHHRLCMVDFGLDMDQCPEVFCPVCNVLVGVSFVLLRKSVFRKRRLMKSSMYLCM
jgi:hypothetical protein